MPSSYDESITALAAAVLAEDWASPRVIALLIEACTMRSGHRQVTPEAFATVLQDVWLLGSERAKAEVVDILEQDGMDRARSADLVALAFAPLGRGLRELAARFASEGY